MRITAGIITVILSALTALPVNAFVDINGLSDPLAKFQDYLNEIQVNQVWDSEKGSPSVVVAVIDDGIYLNHPDLVDNIWVNKKEVPGNQIDDDENGYIDDEHGWNFIDNSPEMTVKGAHGTEVAGIIGARGDNYIGIAGIAWYVKLMPLIVCNEKSCDIEAVQKAIRYAANNGVDVINLSLAKAGTYSFFHQPFTEVIDYAYQRNVIIVAAAGNGDVEGELGKDLGKFPVSPVCNEVGDQVIGVAALAYQRSTLAEWSNYGRCSQISAPGVILVSTAPPIYSTYEGQYDILLKGTSFSAPIVSGIAALMRSKNRLLRNYNAIQIINKSGEGLSLKINANKAVSEAGASVDLISVTPLNINLGDMLTVKARNFNTSRTVKLLGVNEVTLTPKEMRFISPQEFQIKVPQNLYSGKYKINVDGVELDTFIVVTGQTLNPQPPPTSPLANAPLPTSTIVPPPQTPRVPTVIPKVLGVATEKKFKRTLKIGSNGADVLALQELLIKRKLLILPKGVKPKGYFGEPTRKALLKYQKSLKLKTTGIVDKTTMEKLNAEK